MKDKINEAYEQLLAEGAQGDVIAKKLLKQFNSMIDSEIKKATKDKVEAGRLRNWIQGKIKFAWESER